MAQEICHQPSVVSLCPWFLEASDLGWPSAWPSRSDYHQNADDDVVPIALLPVFWMAAYVCQYKTRAFTFSTVPLERCYLEAVVFSNS